MCGIVGVYHYGRGQAVEAALLDRMNSLLVHRGPDDAGTHLEGRVGLAMRRLSIIDISSGHQPMGNEDGTVWVTCNGEIYNFRELREELEGKGHPFKTRSDTEVILHLYEEMGPECVRRLRGMFAFALWDRRAERLLLARDRIGKKPLVYTLGDGRLAWASEIRSLLELPGISREIAPEAIDLYLGLQYIPSPWTIYKSIRKLPPAHRLVFEKGRARIERYWELPEPGAKLHLSFNEAVEAVREKLREATRLRMVADVPLGAFLSGGLDSSCVVALMSEVSERPVQTFSIGFEEEAFSELPYAREVARRYATQHTEFIVKPEMAKVLPLLAWHYGEPYADSSALPSYYVARETRRHVTVALNGDGGDENFAGYLRYLAMQLERYWASLPGPVRRLAETLVRLVPEDQAPLGILWRVKRFIDSMAVPTLAERYFGTLCYFTEGERAKLYTDAFRASLGPSSGKPVAYLQQALDRAAGADELNRWMRVDFHTYLPECLMVKMDIATMANSLEARSPFLDQEFVELVARLPGRFKLRGLRERGTKHLLKEAFRDRLPPRVYGRGKQGFGVPQGSWFRNELKGYWEEHVLSERALSRGYFREEALRGLWSKHQSGRRDYGYHLWALLMLELWHEQYVDSTGKIFVEQKF